MPTQRALARAGIESIADLARFTEVQVKDMHGIGPSAMVKLRTAMDAAGVQFKPDLRRARRSS